MCDNFTVATKAQERMLQLSEKYTSAFSMNLFGVGGTTTIGYSSWYDLLDYLWRHLTEETTVTEVLGTSKRTVIIEIRFPYYNIILDLGEVSEQTKESDNSSKPSKDTPLANN